MQPSAAQLRALARRDPALGRWIGKLDPYPGFPLASQRRMSYFHYLARAIIYQQLAGSAAEAIYRRVRDLRARTGFLQPEELLDLPHPHLRGAGLSANKLLSLRDLAARVASGEVRLAGIHRLSDADIIERLVQVRGIGEWTAQMFLMFRLGRPDVLPSRDLGVQEGMRRLLGRSRRPEPREIEARGACWAPLRSVGSWYMWRLADGE